MAEYEFQEGDRVICTGATGCRRLEDGKEYTVRDVAMACGEPYLYVLDIADAEFDGFKCSRFRLIRKRAESEGPFRAGDEVEACAAWSTKDKRATQEKGQWYRGRLERNPESSATCRLLNDSGLEWGDGVIGYWVDPSSLRSPAPPPTPPVEKMAERTDPYRAPIPNPNSYALWSAEQERRHAARIEAHKRDLDRATAERERNTRHWPEAWSRPGCES